MWWTYFSSSFARLSKNCTSRSLSCFHQSWRPSPTRPDSRIFSTYQYETSGDTLWIYPSASNSRNPDHLDLHNFNVALIDRIIFSHPEYTTHRHKLKKDLVQGPAHNAKYEAITLRSWSQDLGSVKPRHCVHKTKPLRPWSEDLAAVKPSSCVHEAKTLCLWSQDLASTKARPYIHEDQTLATTNPRSCVREAKMKLENKSAPHLNFASTSSLIKNLYTYGRILKKRLRLTPAP